MEAVGVAASLVQLADAGLKISISLFTFAETVKGANKTIRQISADISVTCGILTQLTALVEPKDSSGEPQALFTPEGLEQVQLAVKTCEDVFDQLQSIVERAGKQLLGAKPSGQKIKLSTSEKAKWPFLLPKIQELRADLFNAKSNIMVVLLIAQLATGEKAASRDRPSSLTLEEKRRLRATVVALRRPESDSGHTTPLLGTSPPRLSEAEDLAVQSGPKMDILAKGTSSLEPTPGPPPVSRPW
ncbi:hypothetical protein B0T10DRAFT_295569 [Thelonectria olida]|uniref:Uncharacterized protein n=1 Tax=Thelonectria olida TaxID=1576542 RepID=A0A9P8W6Z5_9HYPO|nr:hypothetical protein B0T10DRAFT_295569 [Thelonectria olida]